MTRAAPPYPLDIAAPTLEPRSSPLCPRLPRLHSALSGCCGVPRLQRVRAYTRVLCIDLVPVLVLSVSEATNALLRSFLAERSLDRTHYLQTAMSSFKFLLLEHSPPAPALRDLYSERKTQNA